MKARGSVTPLLPLTGGMRGERRSGGSGRRSERGWVGAGSAGRGVSGSHINRGGRSGDVTDDDDDDAVTKVSVSHSQRKRGETDNQKCY